MGGVSKSINFRFKTQRKQKRKSLETSTDHKTNPRGKAGAFCHQLFLLPVKVWCEGSGVDSDPLLGAQLTQYAVSALRSSVHANK